MILIIFIVCLAQRQTAMAEMLGTYQDENLGICCLCIVLVSHFVCVCARIMQRFLWTKTWMDGPALCAMTKFPEQIIKLFFDYNNNIGQQALSESMPSTISFFHFSHQCSITPLLASLLLFRLHRCIGKRYAIFQYIISKGFALSACRINGRLL